jgi:hypothetical protein
MLLVLLVPLLQLHASEVEPRPVAGAPTTMPPLPPPPTPCAGCLINPTLQLAAAASRPLGWEPYTWTNSSFAWRAPPTAIRCQKATARRITGHNMSLEISGGSGAWAAHLNISAAVRDRSWPAGQPGGAGGGLTAVISVRLSYCAQHVRERAKVTAYVSGVRTWSALPGWGRNSGGIVGWATAALSTPAAAREPGEGGGQRHDGVYFGDIRVPVADASSLKLNLRLDDGPTEATAEGQPPPPPTSVFFTEVAVL